MKELFEAIRAGDSSRVAALTAAARAGRAKIKIIFENAYLDDATKIRLCEICGESGVDWVKTSTGFASSGATVADVQLMRKHSPPHVQVKASGGIRTLDALLAMRELIPPKEAFLKAKAAARKALEIDNTLGEAYVSLAHIRLHDWDWSGLEEEFKHAIELNPGHAIAYLWYSEYLMVVGRSEEAIAIARQAQEVDPLSPVINSAVANALYCARKYDQAIKHLLAGLEVNPNNFTLHFRLAYVYLQKGMYEEAIEEMQKAMTLSGRSTETLAGLGRAYAAAGMREETQKVLDELSESAKERYVCPHHVAQIYAALGDKEQAFHWLEKAYEEHSPDLIDLKIEPALDSLRTDARFRDLLRRVGLAPATD